MTSDDKITTMFLDAKAAFDEEYPPGSPGRERIERTLARHPARRVPLGPRCWRECPASFLPTQAVEAKDR